VAHICSTDSICHVLGREEFRKYLIQVDRLLREVFIREKAQLDVVVFSDHGNSHVPNRRVNLDQFLVSQGFRMDSSIRDEKSVVIPAFGLVGTIPVYCRPQSTSRLARIFTGLQEIDFTTYLDQEIVRIVSARGRAGIAAKDSGGRLKYTPLDGDPLELTPIIQRMCQLGQLDAEGYASADDWFRATAEHEYPDAVNALYRGVTDHVANRASLLVCFRDGHHYGRPFFDWLVNMRSTHGNLRRTSVTGFYMRNGPLTREILPARELLRDWMPANRSTRNDARAPN
jgi:hypothetical protein